MHPGWVVSLLTFQVSLALAHIVIVLSRCNYTTAVHLGPLAKFGVPGSLYQLHTVQHWHRIWRNLFPSHAFIGPDLLSAVAARARLPVSRTDRNVAGEAVKVLRARKRRGARQHIVAMLTR